MSIDKNLHKQLIKALKSKNIANIDKSFERLYEIYFGIVFFVTLNIVQDKMETEEIVNDTFLTLFYNIDKIDQDKNLKSWLITTAKHKAIDLLRIKSKYHLMEESIIDHYNPDNYSLNHEDIFLDIKQVLDESEFYIIIERFIYNSSFKDIAVRMNTKIGTVTSKYSRAIKKMRVFFK